MKRYAIRNISHAEISKRDYDKYGNILDAFIANGNNYTYDEIGVFDDLEKAKEELQKYKCSYGLANGWANVSFYSANLYYIEELEYDEDYEEWENIGIYDFAPMEN